MFATPRYTNPTVGWGEKSGVNGNMPTGCKVSLGPTMAPSIQRKEASKVNGALTLAIYPCQPSPEPTNSTSTGTENNYNRLQLAPTTPQIFWIPILEDLKRSIFNSLGFFFFLYTLFLIFFLLILFFKSFTFLFFIALLYLNLFGFLNFIID
jgi:hypothetical protein